MPCTRRRATCLPASRPGRPRLSWLRWPEGRARAATPTTSGCGLRRWRRRSKSFRRRCGRRAGTRPPAPSWRRRTSRTMAWTRTLRRRTRTPPAARICSSARRAMTTLVSPTRWTRPSTRRPSLGSPGTAASPPSSRPRGTPARTCRPNTRGFTTSSTGPHCSGRRCGNRPRRNPTTPPPRPAPTSGWCSVCRRTSRSCTAPRAVSTAQRSSTRH
mmetsp:Transcript_33989/g.109807  ORF Transcript_33989/g.109807 Transcript_33989/m.109807 type:complete len:215 (-) Transcript_33989:820-1464(-)